MERVDWIYQYLVQRANTRRERLDVILLLICEL